MSRQDKATTERNARILRDLVKQPDNKACADCRKNDARWASWNLGVYLCIRCSGIHRAMGTHISKVKSIDLDIWQPEQMENIQKWGNKRANAYWERHLKAGHVPPEHKIESFIRSKYESRRWAMEGPIPRDPSVLDDVAAAKESGVPPPPIPQQSRPTPTPTSAPAPRPAAQAHPLLSRQTKAAPPQATAAPLLNFFDDEPSAPAAQTTAPPAPAPAAVPSAPSQPPATQGAAPTGPTAAPAAPSGNIFDLDFKPPTPQPKPTTNKADIMSLFSQAPTQPQTGGFFQATAAPSQHFGNWNGGVTASSPPRAQPATAPVPTWGFNDQAAWGSGAQQQPQQTQQPQQQQQQWGQSQNQTQWGQSQQAQQPQQSQWGQQNSTIEADPWAQPVPAQAAPAKKDERDPFANIWG